MKNLRKRLVGAGRDVNKPFVAMNKEAVHLRSGGRSRAHKSKTGVPKATEPKTTPPPKTMPPYRKAPPEAILPKAVTHKTEQPKPALCKPPDAELCVLQPELSKGWIRI